MARRPSLLVAAGILLSRLAGFVRQRAFGHFLGTSEAADAFTAALRIPNLLQNLLGEGVLSASFIPVYSRLLGLSREREAGRVAGAVAGLLLVVTGVLAVVGVVFARPITVALTPGFEGERLDLTVQLVRIITPGVGFLVLSAWCLGILNSHRRFFLSYVAPVLWNGAQIAALVGLGLVGMGRSGLAVALAWGTVAGGVLQLAVQLPGALRVSRDLRLSLHWDLPGVRSTIRGFGPMLAGRGVVQLSVYVQLVLASLLVEGAVAVLGFAQMLYLLPISLFGMSVAAAELPELSRVGEADWSHLSRRIDVGLRRVAFFVVPTAVAYVVIGDVLVGAVYRSGVFGTQETRVVWLTLAGFSVGLLATTASRLLQSALYAVGDTTGPAVIAGLRVLVSVAVGWTVMLQLDRLGVGSDGSWRLLGDLPAFAPVEESVRSRAAGEPLRLGAAGLALGAGVGAWLEYWLLRRRVERRSGRRVRHGGGSTTEAAAAAAIGAIGAIAVHALLSDVHPLLAAPAVAGAFGIAYLVVALRMGLPEARAGVEALRNQLDRVRRQ